jgi:hypothetical protein
MIYYFPGFPPTTGGSNWERVDAPGRQVLYPKNDKGTNVVIGDDNDILVGQIFRFKALMGRAAMLLNDDGTNAVIANVIFLNSDETLIIDVNENNINLGYTNAAINKIFSINIDNSTIRLNAVNDNGGPAQKDTILQQDENELIISASDAATAESVRFGIGANVGIYFQELVSTTIFFGMKPTGQMFANLAAFDDDTAAGGAGLVAGDMYQTTGAGAAPLNVAGIVMVKQ